jgi:DNA/RNA endonuclease YhcR with UshA esterase domain
VVNFGRHRNIYAIVALALIVPFALFRLHGVLHLPGGNFSGATPTPIAAADAAGHIGTYASVTGNVAAVDASSGGTLFLDLGAAYPNESLTAVIFPRNRSRFPSLADLQGRTIQLTGRIESYRGRPEIVLTSPSQLRLVD